MSKRIGERAKKFILQQEVLVVVLWGVSIASLLSWDLFRGTFPQLQDLGILGGFSFVSGVVISNLEKTLFGFVAAIIIGTFVAYFLAVLPALTGTVQPPGDQAVYVLWSTLIFRAVFPLPIVLMLITALVGAGIGETYLD